MAEESKLVDKLEKESKEIKWTELPHDILATTYIPNVREFGKDKTIAVISTDYFGGWGIQEAKLFVKAYKYFIALLDLNLPDAPNGEVVDYMLQKKQHCIVHSSRCTSTHLVGIG